VIREIVLDASPEAVWAAVGDVAKGPLRLAPDVFVDSRMEDADTRTLVFADGTVVRERLIARDEQARRIVWGWIGDQVIHDNASMQVFAEGKTRSRVVWIHDTLPDTLVGWLATAMDQLAPVFQKTLRSQSENREPMSHDS
jgi:hypothetical protein